MAKLSVASAVDWLNTGMDKVRKIAEDVTGVTGGLKQITNTIKSPVNQATGSAGSVSPGTATKADPEPFKYMPVILIAGFILLAYMYFKNR